MTEANDPTNDRNRNDTKRKVEIEEVCDTSDEESEEEDDTTDIDRRYARATAEVWQKRPDLYSELEVMDRDPDHPFTLSSLELEYEPCWIHSVAGDRCQAGRRPGLRAEHEHVTLGEMSVLKESAEVFDSMLKRIEVQDDFSDE